MPLTAEKVEGVLTVFKKGRYRSIGNYLSVAKSMHIRAGHGLDEQLLMEMAAGRRSVTRGIGPAKQCEELPLANLLPAFGKLETRILPPKVVKNLTAIGCFFILREVELTLMLLTSVTFNVSHKLITIW